MYYRVLFFMLTNTSLLSSSNSIQFNLDAGHTVFSEEVFEQQARVPGGAWIDAPTHWGDVRGDPASPRDEINCPSGWAWRDFWTVSEQIMCVCVEVITSRVPVGWLDINWTKQE